MSRSMIASIITVTQVSIELWEKKKVDKNIDIRVIDFSCFYYWKQ